MDRSGVISLSKATSNRNVPMRTTHAFKSPSNPLAVNFYKDINNPKQTDIQDTHTTHTYIGYTYAVQTLMKRK